MSSMSAAQPLTMKYKPLFWVLVLLLPVISAGLIAIYAKELNFLLFYIVSLICLLLFGLLLTHIKAAFFLLILLRTVSDFQDSFFTSFSLMGLNISAVLSMIVVLTGIYYIFVNRIRILSLPLSKPFLVLLIFSFLSVVLSANLYDGLQEWVRLLSFYVIYLVFTCAIKNKDDIKKLVAIFLISIIMPAVVAIYQLFTGTGNLETAGFNRVMGTFAHPMQFSYFLLFIITLLLVLSLESKRKDLIFLAVSSSLFLSFLLYYSYTRAAWLGLVAILVVLGYMRYRKLLYAVPIFLIIMAIFFSSTIAERFEDLNFTKARAAGEWGNSLDARYRTWGDTAPLFLKNPVIGNGYGTSEIVVEEAPHNDYLKLLAETGILGFGAYLWLLLATIRSAGRNFIRRQSSFYKGLALVFFIQIIILAIFSIDSNMLRNIAFQWSFWALAAAVYKSGVLEGQTTKNQPVNNLGIA